MTDIHCKAKHVIILILLLHIYLLIFVYTGFIFCSHLTYFDLYIYSFSLFFAFHALPCKSFKFLIDSLMVLYRI